MPGYRSWKPFYNLLLMWVFKIYRPHSGAIVAGTKNKMCQFYAK